MTNDLESLFKAINVPSEIMRSEIRKDADLFLKVFKKKKRNITMKLNKNQITKQQACNFYDKVLNHLEELKKNRLQAIILMTERFTGDHDCSTSTIEADSSISEVPIGLKRNLEMSYSGESKKQKLMAVDEEQLQIDREKSPIEMELVRPDEKRAMTSLVIEEEEEPEDEAVEAADKTFRVVPESTPQMAVPKPAPAPVPVAVPVPVAAPVSVPVAKPVSVTVPPLAREKQSVTANKLSWQQQQQQQKSRAISGTVKQTPVTRPMSIAKPTGVATATQSSKTMATASSSTRTPLTTQSRFNRDVLSTTAQKALHKPATTSAMATVSATKTAALQKLHQQHQAAANNKVAQLKKPAVATGNGAGGAGGAVAMGKTGASNAPLSSSASSGCSSAVPRTVASSNSTTSSRVMMAGGGVAVAKAVVKPTAARPLPSVDKMPSSLTKMSVLQPQQQTVPTSRAVSNDDSAVFKTPFGKGRPTMLSASCQKIVASHDSYSLHHLVDKGSDDEDDDDYEDEHNARQPVPRWCSKKGGTLANLIKHQTRHMRPENIFRSAGAAPINILEIFGSKCTVKPGSLEQWE